MNRCVVPRMSSELCGVAAEARRWKQEAERWRQRAEETASDRERALERELRQAEECIATLRAARWKPIDSDGTDATELIVQRTREEAERELLQRELNATEHALQDASSAACALGAKAEALLHRLAAATAVQAQMATAQLLRGNGSSSTATGLLTNSRASSIKALGGQGTDASAGRGLSATMPTIAYPCKSGGQRQASVRSAARKG
jgi:hypothetical protein